MSGALYSNINDVFRRFFFTFEGVREVIGNTPVSRGLDFFFTFLLTGTYYDRNKVEVKGGSVLSKDSGHSVV